MLPHTLHNLLVIIIFFVEHCCFYWDFGGLTSWFLECLMLLDAMSSKKIAYGFSLWMSFTISFCGIHVWLSLCQPFFNLASSVVANYLDARLGRMEYWVGVAKS